METSTSVPGATPQPPPPAPPGERVAKANAEASARAATVAAEKNRGRGRPATPGSPHSQFKTNGAKLAPGEKQPGAKSDSPAFAPGVVERAVASLCGTVDRFVQRRTYHTAFVLTKEEPLARLFAEEVAMSADERQQIATLSEAVCHQYQIMGQHAPAIFLGAHLIGYGTKCWLVLSKLEEIAKVNRQHPAPAAAPAPEAKAA